MRCDQSNRKKMVVFIDCGDTLADEASQVFAENEREFVLSASLIPGAEELLKALHERGNPICLVADGQFESFRNILLGNGVYHLFDAFICSEQMNAVKPAAPMFSAAMGAMELAEADKPRILMVGNNLERDIAGANAAGLVSVHLDWTPRYPKTPANPLEQPNHTIHQPLELLDLVERLEKAL